MYSHCDRSLVIEGRNNTWPVRRRPPGSWHAAREKWTNIGPIARPVDEVEYKIDDRCHSG